MGNELGRAGFKELLLWLLRFRRRFRVAGDSMSPFLEQGDEVLVDPRAYHRESPRPGDVVIAQHPYRADVRLIKRVAAALEDDRYHLQGDNPSASADSRSFGAVPRKYILARVLSRFP